MVSFLPASCKALEDICAIAIGDKLADDAVRRSAGAKGRREEVVHLVEAAREGVLALDQGKLALGVVVAVACLGAQQSLIKAQGS